MLKGVTLPRLSKVIGESAADLVREKCSSGIPVTLSKAIFAPPPSLSPAEKENVPRPPRNYSHRSVPSRKMFPWRFPIKQKAQPDAG